MGKPIDIDTEKLLSEIDKLEKARNSIKEVFENSSKENKNLNEDWSSDTSQVVDGEFERFDKAGQDYIERLDGYIEYETVENQLIDENIATH